MPKIEWITRLGREHRIPLTFLAMVNEQDPHDCGTWFASVHEANAGGAAIRPQVACRAFGMLMGHQSRMNPFRHRPSYRSLMDLPLASGCSDSAIRRSVPASWVNSPIRRRNHQPTNSAIAASLRGCTHSVRRSDYEPAAEDSVAAIAERQGRDPWEVAYDILLGADAGGIPTAASAELRR